MTGERKKFRIGLAEEMRAVARTASSSPAQRGVSASGGGIECQLCHIACDQFGGGPLCHLACDQTVCRM
jgi:hypothetical protein